MVFVWTLNSLALLLITFSSSKRSRVEAMYGLRDVEGISGFVVEDSFKGTAPMPPLFYAGIWDKPVQPYTDATLDLREVLSVYPVDVRPNIILFIGEEELEDRMARVERSVGPLEVLYRAEPGTLDRLVHWVNEVNRNETITVARVQ